MKNRSVSLALVGVFALLLVGSYASAEGGMTIKVSVPFSFTVGGKEMASGPYQFRLEGTDQTLLSIVDARGGKATTLSPMTRLANLGSSKVQVVFDVSDGKHYLSEIHVPGIDGFAFEGAPGKHTHAEVPGQ